MATLRNTAIGLLRHLRLPNISRAVKHLDRHSEQIAALASSNPSSNLLVKHSADGRVTAMPTIGEPARPKAVSLRRLMTQRTLVLLTQYSAQYFAVTLTPSLCRIFDLTTDPLEQVNLVDQSQYSAVLSRLLQNLKTWMRDTQDPLLEGPIASPQYRKALRILDGTVSALETVQKGDW